MPADFRIADDVTVAYCPKIVTPLAVASATHPSSAAPASLGPRTNHHVRPSAVALGPTISTDAPGGNCPRTSSAGLAR